MVEPPPHLPNGNETVEICINLHSMINSVGIWENPASLSSILAYPLPLLELQMLLTFFFTHLILAIFKPLGITIFASQMLAGVIMGPLMMGKLDAFKNIYINAELGVQFIDTAAMFGFSIFTFIMGVKVDPKIIFTAPRRAKVVGIVSMVSPSVVGLVVYLTLKNSNQSSQLTVERLMLIGIQSSTSFSVIACLLSELKIITSELGRLALSSAIINDFCNFFAVFFIDFYRRWNISPSFAMIQLGMAIPFIMVLFCVFRPLMFWVIRTTPEGRPIKEGYIIVIMMTALGCFTLTYWTIGDPLFGAMLFGLAVPDGPPLGSTLINKFECFANGIFLAAFVTTSTMSVDPKMMLSDSSTLQFASIFVVFTFLAKFIPTFIASIWSMLPVRDSLAFALIMSSRGIVEFTVFTSFRNLKVITDATYAVFTFFVLVNATLIPIMLKFLYKTSSRKYAGYENKTLMHLKPNSELHILACIHRPENVPGLINFLDLTCPTKESPIIIYALHLIELIGRDFPIFIAHQRQKDGAVSSSFKHILPFKEYEKNNSGLVTVNAFTAISPPKLMDEDINTMALDKKASFLILPFHRNFSMEGSIDVDNNVIRKLNYTILDGAPCSIGILVDRGMLSRGRKLLGSSSYSICMIFLGGKDDREALTLAKRMAHDPRVKLTLIHLIPDHLECNDLMDWDSILDVEMLKDIKKNEGNNGCNILYIKEVSNNGLQTASIIKSIANDYDLIIVGRRHGLASVQTDGLSEWNEVPELGVVGDLLSSTDLDSKACVLVVQQQEYIDVHRR